MAARDMDVVQMQVDEAFILVVVTAILSPHDPQTTQPNLGRVLSSTRNDQKPIRMKIERNFKKVEGSRDHSNAPNVNTHVELKRSY